jgi:hypothetical protein
MYTPTARLVTHRRFHKTLHTEVQPMLKSIAVVAGSYVLSIILVLGTDPLLSRLFPGDFVKGRIPSNAALIASTAFFVVISILCAWICARFASQPRRDTCVVVLYCRGSDGHGGDDSQLGQGLAALVLVVVAAELAGKLLDWPAAGWAAGGSDVGGGDVEVEPRLIGRTPSSHEELVANSMRTP